MIRRAGLTAGGLGVVAAGWLVAVVVGPSGPAFALVTHLSTTVWVGAVLDACHPALSSRWFTVRTWEPRLWRWLGVGGFRSALRGVGWERVVARRRGFDGTRAGLSGLDRHTRGSELCHLVVGAVGTVAVAVALACGDVPAALWLGCANLLFHPYPVLLQRALRERISRIRAGTGTPGGVPDRSRPLSTGGSLGPSRPSAPGHWPS